MSRIGKAPIKVESGVKVNVQDTQVDVQGKLGKLQHQIPDGIQVELKGDEVRVVRKTDQPRHRALHGLTRTLIANMIQGVAKGYTKSLELQGVGYRAQTKGQTLSLALGFSHPVEVALPEGLSAKVEANTKIHLTSADKELLGRTAASIRKIRPPEPYKGKGVRYLGEVVRRKAGKAAAGGK